MVSSRGWRRASEAQARRTLPAGAVSAAGLGHCCVLPPPRSRAPLPGPADLCEGRRGAVLYAPGSCFSSHHNVGKYSSPNSCQQQLLQNQPSKTQCFKASGDFLLPSLFQIECLKGPRLLFPGKVSRWTMMRRFRRPVFSLRGRARVRCSEALCSRVQMVADDTRHFRREHRHFSQ